MAWMRSTLRWVAAGLEVSALGAALAIALLVLLSRFSSMPWYSYGNLLATGIYPSTVLDERQGYWTFAGFSLAFLYFVGAGLLYSVVFRSRRRGIGPHLVGVAYALGLFLAGDRLWWQAWSPYIIIYGVHAHLMWSHVVFGVSLGWLPARRVRRDGETIVEDTPGPETKLLGSTF